MIRNDVLKSLLPVLRDHLVIGNIGAPSQELFALADRPQNFYMLGTMGLCSSIGLGVALAQPKPVIAIDGDGSVLTNLGTLATVAHSPVTNFILVIIDNGAYGSTGNQPTYTGRRTSLAAVALGCGCENVVECAGEEAAGALTAALDAKRTTVIVVKCESGNASVPAIRMDPGVIRQRFMDEVAREA